MDYSQFSPLPMAIWSENPCFFGPGSSGANPRVAADPILLLRLRCPTRRWFRDQLGPSIHASEAWPEKLLSRWCDFGAMFLFPTGEPFTRVAWGIAWWRGDLEIYFLGFRIFAQSKDNGRTIDSSCPDKSRDGHPVVFPCLCSAVEGWKCRYLGQQGLWRGSLEFLEFMHFVSCVFGVISVISCFSQFGSFGGSSGVEMGRWLDISGDRRPYPHGFWSSYVTLQYTATEIQTFQFVWLHPPGCFSTRRGHFDVSRTSLICPCSSYFIMFVHLLGSSPFSSRLPCPDASFIKPPGLQSWLFPVKNYYGWFKLDLIR